MIHIASLADPTGSSVFVAAVAWLQETLLGTIATTFAITGVASIGYRMLTGRIDIRRGATIISGCFIVLGAASIAAGIRSVAEGFGGAPAITALTSVDPPPTIAVTVPVENDPYAGAAVFR